MSQSSVSVYAYYAREKKNFSFFPLRPNTYMEITRIKEEVGYRPQYDIRRGVEEYIEWLRTHPE
jgi:nucleoside-diphosphate-sugar epimerase